LDYPEIRDRPANDGAPVSEGDRILLAPGLTGADIEAWAEVELVENVPEPKLEPWNTGPEYPWRVGYRLDLVSQTAGVEEQRGVLWMNFGGADLSRHVISIDRKTSRQT
jgi:hypothetical protein